jgi:hypothetical protein
MMNVGGLGIGNFRKKNSFTFNIQARIVRNLKESKLKLELIGAL